MPEVYTTEAPIDKVLEHLEGVRKQGNGFKARCPSHDDRTASLSVSIGDDGETVLLNCFAGCDKEDILEAIGLQYRDLFPPKDKPGPKLQDVTPSRAKVVARYNYVCDDQLIFQVERLEPKSFRQRHPDGNGGWEWSMKGVKRCLYHHDEVAKATSPVYYCEGEKDTDRLRKLGFTATTAAGGANGPWLPDYTDALAGMDVVILPHNDTPGRKRAQEVANHIYGTAASVRIADLTEAWPELPEHGDVSDFLDIFTADDFVDFVAEMPEWTPLSHDNHRNNDDRDEYSQNGQYDDAPRLITRLASTIEAKDIDWLWKPWLPAGMLTLLAGYGGVGKSTVALHIAAACSSGGYLPDGQRAPTTSSLIFAAEDSPEHTIIPRLRFMGADMDRIHIVDGVYQPNGDPGWVQLRNHAALIEQSVIEHQIGLVIIDPVSSYIGDANSDKEADVRMGIMPLMHMAERTGATVIMIRHVTKGGDSTRAASRILGSTAWHDVPRAVLMLADAPDDNQPEPREDGLRDTRRVLGVVKSNLAAKPQARWALQPVDGAMTWDAEPSPVSIDQCFGLSSGQGSRVRDAEEWLKERLAGGSQPTVSVEAAAFTAGISKAALKRARAALNVRARKEPSGEWVLSLPPKLVLLRREDAQIEGVQSEPHEPVNPLNALNTLHNDDDPRGAS